MRKHDLISSAIWFFVGLFIVVYSPAFDLGTPSVPGAGFMPFLAGVLMCLFSALTFSRAYLDKSADTESLWVNIQFRKLIFVVIILIIYTFSMDKIGFIISTFLFIMFVMRFGVSRSWLSSFICAILSSIFSYFLFDTLLRATLPKGVFGF